MEKHIYDSFVDILREELVPAMGCTEPIAVAYAAALARDTPGCMPEKITLIVSGNIIKNVKSVVVPNTGGRKGLRTAVAAGLCAVSLSAGSDTAYVHIVSHHTNVVCIRKNDEILLEKPFSNETIQAPENRSPCLYE